MTELNESKVEVEEGLSLASIFVYLLLGPSLIAYHAFERAKFIYFIPVLMLVISLIIKLSQKESAKYFKFDFNVFIALLIYLTITALSLITPLYDKFMVSNVIRDVLILLSPLVVFLAPMEFTDRHIKFLFISVVISFFAWVGLDNDFEFSFNLLKSNFTDTEYHNGVILGGFVFYFFRRKAWVWLIAVAVLVVLSGKRSIFLGLIPAFGTYYLFIKPLKIDGKTNLLAFILLAYYTVFFLIGMNLISFSTWMLKFLGMQDEISVEKFLLGREVFIEYLTSAIKNSDLINYVFGHGAGQADVFILREVRPDWVNMGIPVNPHNDFLKIFFDYGLLGAIMFFPILYIAHVKSKIGIMTFLYTIPIFLVDNSLIFVYYWLLSLTLARTSDN